MNYADFLRNQLSPMEVLDRLIAAGLGDIKPQYRITRQEFDAAMLLPAEAIVVRWDRRTDRSPCGRNPKYFHREVRARYREEVFPSCAVSAGWIHARREIARCE